MTRAKQSVAILDYGAGNLRSVCKAIERTGNATIHLARHAEDVLKADRIILPGDGAFADCRQNLFAIDGMIEALEEAVLKRARPFLGICVGMQLLADHGLEHGTTPGLGWISGTVRSLHEHAMMKNISQLRIPHMGWNNIIITRPHKLLSGIEQADVYFLHSYYFADVHEENIIAKVDYAGPFAAIIGRENMIACQFHPEKSQRAGLALLHNFVKWVP